MKLRELLRENEEVCVISITGRLYRGRAHYQNDRPAASHWRVYQRKKSPRTLLYVIRPEEEGLMWARGWERETADALLAAYLLAAPR